MIGNTNVVNKDNHVTYSLTEELTGDVWVDGRPIYRKVFWMSSLPNATTVNVDSGITDELTIITLRGVAYTSSFTLLIPHISINASQIITIYYNKANHFFQINTSSTDRRDYMGYVIIEYTKSTDQGTT